MSSDAGKIIATIANPVQSLVGMGVAGPYEAYKQQKLAASNARQAEQKANDISRSSAQVELAHRRRMAIAQARILQAQNIASAASEGTTGSALTGSNVSIDTNLGANIADLNSQFASGQAAFDLRQGAANSLNQGQQNAARALLPTQLLQSGLQLAGTLGITSV